MEVRLIRKNKRWELYEKTLFSSAAVADVTLVTTSTINPQDVHQTCVQNLQGTFTICCNKFDLFNFNFMWSLFRDRKIIIGVKDDAI